MTNQMPERIWVNKDTCTKSGYIAVSDEAASIHVKQLRQPYIRADIAQKTVTRYELENVLINAYEKNRPISSAISALIASGIVKVHP